MKGAIAKGEEISQGPELLSMPQQFKNPANPEIHFRKPPAPKSGKTRAERSTSSSPGVGTGGTITGVSRYIKQGEETPDAGGGG